MAKIIGILIAYNAEKTLANFYKEFPHHLVDDLILVDDASHDRTYAIAKKLGIHSFKNEVNLGYGGNVKRALSLALNAGADIIVDIHPDREYKPSAIPLAIQKIKQGAEFVLGNRFSNIKNPIKSGMYFWKFIPILTLNWIDKIIFQADISDYHQGFRVYTRKMLEKVNFEQNSNSYLFSFELIAQAVLNNVVITQVPVETNYTGKKRGASLKHSVNYSIGTFGVILLFLLAKYVYRTKVFRLPIQSLNERIKRYI